MIKRLLIRLLSFIKFKIIHPPLFHLEAPKYNIKASIQLPPSIKTKGDLVSQYGPVFDYKILGCKMFHGAFIANDLLAVPNKKTISFEVIIWLIVSALLSLYEKSLDVSLFTWNSWHFAQSLVLFVTFLNIGFARVEKHQQATETFNDSTYTPQSFNPRKR